MRHTQAEKYELILLVERSELGVNRTLNELGLRKSTFYNWYNKYLENGYDGLAEDPCTRNKFWNQIPEEEKKLIIDLALDNPQMYSRELSFLFTDIYHVESADGLEANSNVLSEWRFVLSYWKITESMILCERKYTKMEK